MGVNYLSTKLKEQILEFLSRAMQENQATADTLLVFTKDAGKEMFNFLPYADVEFGLADAEVKALYNPDSALKNLRQLDLLCYVTGKRKAESREQAGWGEK
jgi:hypothetical protein